MTAILVVTGVVTVIVTEAGSHAAAESASADVPWMTVDRKNIPYFTYADGVTVRDHLPIDFRLANRHLDFAIRIVNEGATVGIVNGFLLRAASPRSPSWGNRFKAGGWAFAPGKGNILSTSTTLTEPEYGFLQAWVTRGRPMEADVWYQDLALSSRFTEIVKFTRNGGITTVTPRTVKGEWVNYHAG